MGSCAAPSAKGDDKFITTDYLQQCQIPGVHKTDPLLKPGSKWRHDVPIEPSWIFVSERPDLYGLAV
ncbi:hypothetical protein, partial [Klebsiella pneumoniae]|uniref:hypothetical protein n=1 Tax=Klebsiella pneumoniae TaxID=573 RepID=UPI00272E2BB4